MTTYLRQKKTKYHSKKIELDGHVFDSKLEARYYEQLKWLEQADQILFFRLQPGYLLQPAFVMDGKKHRKIEFVGDFEIQFAIVGVEVRSLSIMEPGLRIIFHFIITMADRFIDYFFRLR